VPRYAHRQRGVGSRDVNGFCGALAEGGRCIAGDAVDGHPLSPGCCSALERSGQPEKLRLVGNGHAFDRIRVIEVHVPIGLTGPDGEPLPCGQLSRLGLGNTLRRENSCGVGAEIGDPVHQNVRDGDIAFGAGIAPGCDAGVYGFHEDACRGGRAAGKVD